MCRAWKCVAAVVIAMAMFLVPGCGGKSTPGSGQVAIELQYEVIDLAPGDQKEVKVVSGKAATVVTKGKAVDAKLDGDNLVVAAANNARGQQVVRVLDSNGKDAWLTVNIKRAR